jgi:hypothetical protein
MCRKDCSNTDKELFSDLNGNLTGFLKVSGIYKLSGSGDKYSGNSTFEVLDPEQKSLNPPITGTVSNSGERISVEVRHAQP